MAASDLITIVGAGDVVAKRLLPAITTSELASKVRIIHNGICDIDATNVGFAEVIDLSSMGDGAAGWLSDYFRSNTYPVIVATPPLARSFYLHKALQGGGLVIAEKPLYTTEAQRHEFPNRYDELRRLFALSYYMQEKAVAWSWLQKPSEFQERMLAFGDDSDSQRTRELFAELGELEAVEIAICEGAAHARRAERRFWFETLPEGVWFDMGVHIFSLLFAASQTVSITRVNSNSSLTQFSINGAIDGARFKCDFGKDFAGPVERRYLIAKYSNGKVVCDVNSCSSTIRHKRLGSTVISSRYGSQRYRTMIEQVRGFIVGHGWSSTEERRDALSWQRQGLDALIEAWPAVARSAS